MKQVNSKEITSVRTELPSHEIIKGKTDAKARIEFEEAQRAAIIMRKLEYAKDISNKNKKEAKSPPAIVKRRDKKLDINLTNGMELKLENGTIILADESERVLNQENFENMKYLFHNYVINLRKIKAIQTWWKKQRLILLKIKLLQKTIRLFLRKSKNAKKDSAATYKAYMLHKLFNRNIKRRAFVSIVYYMKLYNFFYLNRVKILQMFFRKLLLAEKICKFIKLAKRPFLRKIIFMLIKKTQLQKLFLSRFANILSKLSDKLNPKALKKSFEIYKIKIKKILALEKLIIILNKLLDTNKYEKFKFIFSLVKDKSAAGLLFRDKIFPIALKLSKQCESNFFRSKFLIYKFTVARIIKFETFIMQIAHIFNKCLFKNFYGIISRAKSKKLFLQKIVAISDAQMNRRASNLLGQSFRKYKEKVEKILKVKEFIFATQRIINKNLLNFIYSRIAHIKLPSKKLQHVINKRASNIYTSDSNIRLLAISFSAYKTKIQKIIKLEKLVFILYKILKRLAIRRFNIISKLKETAYNIKKDATLEKEFQEIKLNKTPFSENQLISLNLELSSRPKRKRSIISMDMKNPIKNSLSSLDSIVNKSHNGDKIVLKSSSREFLSANKQENNKLASGDRNKLLTSRDKNISNRNPKKVKVKYILDDDEENLACYNKNCQCRIF